MEQDKRRIVIPPHERYGHEKLERTTEIRGDVDKLEENIPTDIEDIRMETRNKIFRVLESKQ